MADEQELDTSEGGIENIVHQVETGQDETSGPQEYPKQIFQRERVVSPDPDDPSQGPPDVAEARGSSDERPELPPPDPDEG